MRKSLRAEYARAMTYAPLAANARAAIDAVVTGEADGLSVATSGSTGAPRSVLLSSRAIRASSFATVNRLGGPGSWLLALPPDRIGGALVALRAGLTEQHLTTMAPGTFTPEGFATAAANVPAGPRYVSLVPTQVVRLMTTPLGRDALALFDSVLVGGAAFGDGERPDNVIETYGMTETAGGCVYDGDPLHGVDVAIGDDDRILISGTTLADGYGDGDQSAWVELDGVRWLRTGDLGRWNAGLLEVLGRADDVIITGAHKVHPVVVERAIMALGGTVTGGRKASVGDASACAPADTADGAVAGVAVVGVDDVEWGKRVVVVVETHGDVDPDAAQLRDALRDTLPYYALPRAIVGTPTMPRTVGGKVDRGAAAALASRTLVGLGLE